MPSLLLPALRPRLCLIVSVNRLLHREGQPCLPHRSWRRPRLRLGVRMTEMARVDRGASPDAGVFGEGDAILGGEESPGLGRQESRWASVEAALNRMSKWLVAGSFAFAAVWKHDAEIMWILLGAVANSLLSRILKKMLNHERPAQALRSDPGMPSSHALSIFYAATVLVLSLFFWLGTNSLAVIIGPAILSIATYLSWLRVSQNLHTLNQVIVGAAVGSAFGVLWSMLWHSLVQEAFASSPWVQIPIILGSAVFCVGFVIYIIRHWLHDE